MPVYRCGRAASIFREDLSLSFDQVGKKTLRFSQAMSEILLTGMLNLNSVNQLIDQNPRLE